MLEETCTIYNKYQDGEQDRWIRTVVKGVFWDGVQGAVLRRTGVVGGDSALVIIPIQADTDGKEYLAPSLWARAEDKSTCWTIRPGDSIVRGECLLELDGSSKPLEEYDDALAITAVNLRACGQEMAHLEVRGKEYLWSLL